MPKEILIEMLKEKLMVSFISVLAIYFLMNWITFKLNFQILGIKVDSRKILPGILLTVLYNTCGKQILSNFLYIIILAILLICLTKLIGKDAVTWMRAVWASFIVVFLTGLGVSFFITPMLLNKSLAQFMTTNPNSVIVGSACELMFPLIVLFLLRTINISIIPPVRRKVDIIDIANLYLFAGMFILLFRAYGQTLKNIDIHSGFELFKDVLWVWFIASTNIAVYYFVYKTTRRRIDLLVTQNEQLLILKDQLILKNAEHEEDMKEVKSYIRQIMEDNNRQIAQAKPNSIPDGLSGLEGLSKKDIALIRLVALGRTTEQIAGELDIQPSSVKIYISKLYEKLRLKSRRVDLALFAVKHGIIKKEEIVLDSDE